MVAESVRTVSDQAPLLRPEHRLLETMRGFYPAVTSRTAIAALLKAQELHAGFPEKPPKEVTDGFKATIDGAAADAMAVVLGNGSPFQTVKVGSEGEKEKYYAGEAAPSVLGVYGSSDRPRIAGVSDVVEGTTPLSRLEPGSSSVIAVAPFGEEHCGIRPVPPDSHYMVKFVGPPQVRGVVDLSRPYRENLENIIDALGIRPEELVQVTMSPKKKGRECNWQYVDAALELGVDLQEINVGDFMPGVLAAADPVLFGGRPTLLVGRGGYEEGVMSAVAARALGGCWIGQEYDRETGTAGALMTLDEIVPAHPKDVLVSTSFITDDAWFSQPGIRRVQDRHTVTTMVVTHNGVQFRSDMV